MNPKRHTYFLKKLTDASIKMKINNRKEYTPKGAAEVIPAIHNIRANKPINKMFR
ncbi:hypothetical protein GYA27_00390 [candidate division WWE3 bacterium]|uniref:Uncharacterized protein n=1 Tax=candidate division WWE3 bacterium TaxID=2053526 RepID=A0A7X9DK16_UNCKA|nr:hypothetical protein [candidate division WWE3 bacterium]